MLRVENLSAWYGEARVLRDVSLRVDAGEVVTLVGRNGAGKSTLLRCVMGLHAGQRGTVELDGRDIGRLPVHRRARLGLGWVPDDRGSYASLSVAEQLTLPPVLSPRSGDGVGLSWPLERIFEAFPVLHERRAVPASTLSGGEQQMLALARVLRMGARLLLCDEPTEGLSPLLVQQVGDILRQAKRHGVTVLLVEQNLRFATEVADRHYLLAQGGIAEAMENSEVRSRERELLTYLGI
ncbi:ABC transporter ATP-binding protein [Plantactinospora soyae]|uniref:Branched-chain amino acid transport system ATP-binding protein n=1 Tax=Plantactinospora soyae TaxID=1544732 RepID=A0A927QY66_9ACTN|nr:ABC transporter ATP-binding protein [Plantactinospora soyae]MBE1488880.1 branched-chain amino acid transport system ATP-binding protein [Plantactinospora soyae]